MSHYLELLDWRRLVALLYAEVRSRPHSLETVEWFRRERDHLFKTHPQSPIPVNARESFRSLSYWNWDPLGRVEARFEPVAAETDGQADESVASGEARLLTIGTVSFRLSESDCRLSVMWLDGYGGGVFIPFRDATSGRESYGGGRYLVDTVKGADLGSSFQAGSVTLDFNYAYHPSCTYDPIWPCPLAPPENRLSIPIRLGERLSMESHQ